MSLPSFLVGQIFTTPPFPTISYAGKTVIVTGANSGLGFDCAKHLVRLKISHLVIACRSVEKGEKARQDILAEYPASESLISVWKLDLAVYSSVLAFADRANADLDRLDGVVENAGVHLEEFGRAEDNETMLTVNVVSTMLLAILLLGKLRETGKQHNTMPHISVVGSFLHAVAPKTELTGPKEGQIFINLNDKKSANMETRYNVSKLLQILCVRELASRIEARQDTSSPPQVVINYTAPGWCKTALFREIYDSWPLPRRLALNLIGRSSEEGSRTLVHAISAGPESHGQYLSECQIKPPSSFVRSVEGSYTQEKVWSEMIAKLEQIRPNITALI